ncbi:MAG: cupredoxin domain-containing protein [Candidatus Limnocylindrales bacterium]
MLNDLWTQVIAWSGAVVTPDWAALVALIPLLLLLVVAAFLAITGAKWAAVVPVRGGNARRRLPLTPDGRPVRSPAVGPLLLAAGVFVLAFGLLEGVAWLVGGAITAAAGLVAWAVEVRGAALPGPRPIDRRRLGVLAAGAGSPRGAVPATDATLTARGIAFVQPALTAAAGRPFTVAFDNRDRVPHNLEICDAHGSVVFRGDIVTGPGVEVYDVPALSAGACQFRCTAHPAMTGALTVK